MLKPALKYGRIRPRRTCLDLLDTENDARSPAFPSLDLVVLLDPLDHLVLEHAVTLAAVDDDRIDSWNGDSRTKKQLIYGPKRHDLTTENS